MVPDFERVQTSIGKCPTCHKDIRGTAYDVYSSKRLRCTNCGTELEISYAAASDVNHAIQDVKLAVKKVEDVEREAEQTLRIVEEMMRKGSVRIRQAVKA